MPGIETVSVLLYQAEKGAYCLEEEYKKRSNNNFTMCPMLMNLSKGFVHIYYDVNLGKLVGYEIQTFTLNLIFIKLNGKKQ